MNLNYVYLCHEHVVLVQSPVKTVQSSMVHKSVLKNHLATSSYIVIATYLSCLGSRVGIYATILVSFT